MSYYNNVDAYHKRGIDQDLCSAIAYNEQLFDVDDLEKVYAVWEGANEGDSWRWLFTLKNGKRAYATGWCDFTGWDCLSGMICVPLSSPFVLTPDGTVRGRLRSEVWDAEAANFEDGNPDRVVSELLRQIKDGLKQTWRMKTDIDMGLLGDE